MVIAPSPLSAGAVNEISTEVLDGDAVSPVGAEGGRTVDQLLPLLAMYCLYSDHIPEAELELGKSAIRK